SKLKQQEPIERDSQNLDDILVEPVRQFLDPTKTVVVIPDRYMYRLPFAALQSRKDGRYWVETAPIMESPSVTYLFSGTGIRAAGTAHAAFGSRRFDAYTNKELNTLQEIEAGIRLQ